MRQFAPPLVISPNRNLGGNAFDEMNNLLFFNPCVDCILFGIDVVAQYVHTQKIWALNHFVSGERFNSSVTITNFHIAFLNHTLSVIACS